jgi:hypothetical protein
MRKRELVKLTKLQEQIMKEGPTSLAQAWVLQALKRRFQTPGSPDSEG